MHLVDELGRDLEAATAARWLAEMAVDFAGAPQPLLGRLADVAVAMPIADTYVHDTHLTQTRMIVNTN